MSYEDWSIASYAELCAYWNLYKNGPCKNFPDSDQILAAIELEMKKRENQETFGKTFH